MNLNSLFAQLRYALKSVDLARPVADFLSAILPNGANSVTFTVGTEDTNEIVVSGQVLDSAGEEIAAGVSLKIQLVDDPDDPNFNTNNYTIAAGTDGDCIEVVADKLLEVITEADGDFDISLTLTGAGTVYLRAIGPTGKVLGVSDAITHAA